MKVGSELKKTFKKRTETIDSLLEKPVWGFSLEDFHQVRTEIKKIIAKIIAFPEPNATTRIGEIKA